MSKTQTILEKLHQQLKISGWFPLLKVFVVSQEFSAIIDQLLAFVDEGYRFTPPVKNVLQPFALTPPETLRLIVLAPGPHPRLGVADGLALSQTGNKPEGGLLRLQEALHGPLPRAAGASPGLQAWAEQGVLLLNQSLTTRLDRAASHRALWHPLLVFLLDQLTTHYPHLPWLLVGDQPRELEELLPSHTPVFHVPDPENSPAPWPGLPVLAAVNTVIVQNGQPPICW